MKRVKSHIFNSSKGLSAQKRNNSNSSLTKKLKLKRLAKNPVLKKMNTASNIQGFDRIFQTAQLSRLRKPQSSHRHLPLTKKATLKRPSDKNLFSQNKTYWKKRTSHYMGQRSTRNLPAPDFLKIKKEEIHSISNLDGAPGKSKRNSEKKLSASKRVLVHKKSQLQELITSKLDKVNIPGELIKEHRGLSFTKLELGEKVKMVDYKDIFDKRQAGKVRDQMSIQERLMMTSERNFVIRRALAEKKPINSFSKELDKKKKLKMIQKFKKVFRTTLGKETAPKKPLKLNLFLKSAIKIKQKARTMKEKFLKPKMCKTEVVKTERSCQRKSSRWQNKEALRKLAKSANEKKSKTDLKKLYWSNPKFLAFLNEHPSLKKFFENPLTLDTLKKFTIPHYSQHQVLNRNELTNLMWNVRNFYKCEEQYFNRIHLSFIVGVDLAFKLRMVYKEHGDLMALLFAQLAEDFENFKELVGKSVYQSMKNQQREIQNIKENFKKEAEVYEKRMELANEVQRQKENKDQMVDNERVLMKKLIFDLQLTNEKQLRYIQQLENKEEFPLRPPEANRVQNKFKNIVNKLIPNSTRQRKLSFAMVSSRLIQMKRKTRPPGKIRSFEKKQPKQSEDMNKMFLKRVSTFRKFPRDPPKADTNASQKSDKFTSKNMQTSGVLSIEKEKQKFLNPTSQSQMSASYLNRRSLTKSETRKSIQRLRTRFSCKKSFDKKDSRVRFHYTKDRSKISLDSMDESCQTRQSVYAKKIGPYLVSDLEKVSRFYVVPDGGMRHRAVQTMARLEEKAVQTELSLGQPVFDRVFSDRKTMVGFVKDYLFRQDLDHKLVLKRIADMKEIQEESQSSAESSDSNETHQLRLSIQRQHTKMKTLGRFTKMMRKKKSHSTAINKRLSIMITPLHTQKNFEPNENLMNKSGFNYLSSSHIRKGPASNKFLFNNFSPKNGSITHPKRPQDPYNQTPLMTMNSKNSVTLMGSTSNNKYLLSVSDLSETRQKRKLGELCKKVFRDYLREEILDCRWKKKGTSQVLELITKYLMSEQFKNNKLVAKKKKLRKTIDILKGMLQSVRPKNGESRSLDFEKNAEKKRQLNTENSRKFEDNVLIEINNKPMAMNQKSMRRRSCPAISTLKSLKVDFIQKNKRANIFFNKKFQNLWSAFKLHLQRNISNFEDFKYSKSKPDPDSSLVDVPRSTDLEFNRPNLSYFEAKKIKISNSVRLLRKVLASQRLKSKLGMGVHSIFKTINIIFKEYYCAYLMKESNDFMAFSMKGKPRLIEFVYEFYLKNFGVLNIAEKKLIVLLVSVRKNLDRPRVNLFAKFIGLIPSNTLLQEEFLFYLKATNFLLSKNCYKDKKKAIFQKSNSTGQVLLKNPRFTSYFANLGLFHSKHRIKTLKKQIDGEVIKTGKEKIYNLDLVINRTLLFERQQFSGDPIHFQIFKTLQNQKGGRVDISLMRLCFKHFLHKQYSPFNFKDQSCKDPLSFSSFIDVLKGIIKDSERRGSILLSLPNSSGRDSQTSEELRGRLRKSRLLVENGLFLDKLRSFDNRKGGATPEDNFQMLFNLEKLSRAKLNRSGYKLKIYFQENFYELRKDMIRCYRKINHACSSLQYALKCLLSKMARNFDSYTYRNIDEFFISYYLIKKEIH